MDEQKEQKRINPQDLERARKAVQRAKDERFIRQLLNPLSLLKTAILIGALILIYRLDAGREEESAAPVNDSCNEDDARCLGKRALGNAIDQCMPKLKANSPAGTEWDYSWIEPALHAEGWYMPGKTLIFGGNRLLAKTGGAGQMRMRYFCVTTTYGTYVKHGFLK